MRPAAPSGRPRPFTRPLGEIRKVAKMIDDWATMKGLKVCSQKIFILVYMIMFANITRIPLVEHNEINFFKSKAVYLAQNHFVSIEVFEPIMGKAV